MEKVSLSSIIDAVLENDPNPDALVKMDDNKRNLYRKFEKLIEKLGAEKNIVKKDNRYVFNEADVPIIKVVLKQLYTGNGPVADFVNKKTRNHRPSSKDVQDMIQSLLDEADQQGASEEELVEMMEFFSQIFLLSPSRSFEHCHKYIDALALNLSDLPSSAQAAFLLSVEEMLRREFWARCVQSAFYGKTIAELLACSIDDSNESNKISSPYENYEPEIEYEYMERDRAILKEIQADEDLRTYIEKKAGKKAEVIFAHVVLD